MPEDDKCPQCEKHYMSEAEYRAYVEKTLRLLPDEIKAPLSEYKRRLEICHSCEHLIGRTCAVCGCYPEIRAAKDVMYCPFSYERWH